MIVNAPSPMAQVIGCWEEVLYVVKARKDGWLDVRDKHGVAWTVNPVRAMAIKRADQKPNTPVVTPDALPKTHPPVPPGSLRVRGAPAS